MSPTNRTVVVTGIGATTPLGGDAASTWEGLIAGRSGVRPLDDERYADLPVRIAAQIAVEAKPRSCRAPWYASSTARRSSR